MRNGRLATAALRAKSLCCYWEGENRIPDKQEALPRFTKAGFCLNSRDSRLVFAPLLFSLPAVPIIMP